MKSFLISLRGMSNKPLVCVYKLNIAKLYCPFLIPDVQTPSRYFYNFLSLKCDNDFIRVFFFLPPVAVAIAVPELGPIISLVGALCLSFLGLILPSCIDLVTTWEEPGLGRGYWRLWKNMFIIAFGLLGLFTGVYASVMEIIEEFKKKHWARE